MLQGLRYGLQGDSLAEEQAGAGVPEVVDRDPPAPDAWLYRTDIIRVAPPDVNIDDDRPQGGLGRVRKAPIGRQIVPRQAAVGRPTGMGFTRSYVRIVSPRPIHDQSSLGQCFQAGFFDHATTYSASGSTATASMEISSPRGNCTIGTDRAGGFVGKYSLKSWFSAAKLDASALRWSS